MVQINPGSIAHALATANGMPMEPVILTDDERNTLHKARDYFASLPDTCMVSLEFATPAEATKFRTMVTQYATEESLTVTFGPRDRFLLCPDSPRIVTFRLDTWTVTGSVASLPYSAQF